MDWKIKVKECEWVLIVRRPRYRDLRQIILYPLQHLFCRVPVMIVFLPLNILVSLDGVAEIAGPQKSSSTALPS